MNSRDSCPNCHGPAHGVHVDFISSDDAHGIIILRRDGSLDLRYNPMLPGEVIVGALEQARRQAEQRMAN